MNNAEQLNIINLKLDRLEKLIYELIKVQTSLIVYGRQVDKHYWEQRVMSTMAAPIVEHSQTNRDLGASDIWSALRPHSNKCALKESEGNDKEFFKKYFNVDL